MYEGLVDQEIRSAVADGVAPGIAFGLLAGDRPARRWFAGHHQPHGRGRLVGADSIFDLASLTKPLTTFIWTLQLVEAGRLDLETPLGDHLEVADPGIARAPLWRLLNHTAGFAAHRPFYRGLGPAVLRGGSPKSAAAAVRRMVLSNAPEAPVGSREIYSDLGFMALQWLCEAASGAAFAEVWAKLPGHGRDALSFRPAPGAVDEGCLATELCPWRGRLLQGEVHDDNCWTVGGTAGHAGLFGRLDDVLRLLGVLLRTLAGEDAGLGVSPGLLQAALSTRWMHPDGTRVLGFDTPTPGRSTSGSRFGPRAFGHLGFTGTSIWADPDAGVGMVLLTNRVSPSRENQRIRPFRPRIHDLAWQVVESGQGRFT